jgi:hypothetical protein
LLLQGIGYVKNGAYSKSFPLFLKILGRNPRHEEAKYWLTVSYAKAGVDAFAQAEAKEFVAIFPNSPRNSELQNIIKPASKEKP